LGNVGFTASALPRTVQRTGHSLTTPVCLGGGGGERYFPLCLPI